MRSEDEPEIRNANLVRADREGHPSSDAQAVFRRRENQDCAGWPSGRTQHCGALPARRHRREPLLHLVEGVPGGRQSRLAGDTARAATSGEVKDLRREACALKELVAEQAMELRLLKKSMIA